MSGGKCGEEFAHHPTRPHLVAICTRPTGHAGAHNNVLPKGGQLTDPGPSAPMCPTCKGGGVIDTSPPGVEHTAPWLQTDTDCPDCNGTGLLLESDER